MGQLCVRPAGNKDDRVDVEALATGEDANQVICWGIGSVDCPIVPTKVYMVQQNYTLE